jgi:hypothetical protein
LSGQYWTARETYDGVWKHTESILRKIESVTVYQESCECLGLENLEKKGGNPIEKNLMKESSKE